MDAGLIASRYANALLLYATEQKAEKRIFDDAEALRKALQSKEDLPGCIERLCEPMQRFLALVVRNKRVEYLPAILHDYQVDFRTEVNPDLIGGFIVQVEDRRLDASIATQLQTIRKEWEEKNRKTRKNG